MMVPPNKAESVDATEQVDVESAAEDSTSTMPRTSTPRILQMSRSRAPKSGCGNGFRALPDRSPSESPSSWLWLGLAGWLGYRVHQDHQVQAQRNLYVQVARQTAINLTTIDYAEVDADIKRVLDSATGAFHDEFQNRSKPFVEVVKKVQSKSEGTIAEAGLLSYTKDQAQVLVAVAVKTSMAAAPPDQEPRRWRMRLTVDKTGDSAKVSNVEFVP